MSDGAGTRLTLRAIEIFVAVVKAGSIGEGARTIGAAVSTVSTQVSALERALGIGLIDRAGQSFALTPAGKAFHKRATAILDTIDAARAELADFAPDAVRLLCLALIEELEGDALPALLDHLAEAYPACRFVVRTGFSHAHLQALEARSVDLIAAADDGPPPEWIERHPVVRDPLVLVTAAGLVRGDPSAVLSEAPFVRFTRSQQIARMIEAHLRRSGFSPRNRFEVDTNPALLSLVARTGGWALTTPLGLLNGGGPPAGIEIYPSPFAGLARTISVSARKEAMGTLPAIVAGLLRARLRDRVVPVARERMPWLGEDFRALEP